MRGTEREINTALACKRFGGKEALFSLSLSHSLSLDEDPPSWEEHTRKWTLPACLPPFLRFEWGVVGVVVTCMDTSSSGEICFEFLRLELIP